MLLQIETKGENAEMYVYLIINHIQMILTFFFISNITYYNSKIWKRWEKIRKRHVSHPQKKANNNQIKQRPNNDCTDWSGRRKVGAPALRSSMGCLVWYRDKWRYSCSCSPLPTRSVCLHKNTCPLRDLHQNRQNRQ